MDPSRRSIHWGIQSCEFTYLSEVSDVAAHWGISFICAVSDFSEHKDDETSQSGYSTGILSLSSLGPDFTCNFPPLQDCLEVFAYFTVLMKPQEKEIMVNPPYGCLFINNSWRYKMSTELRLLELHRIHPSRRANIFIKGKKKSQVMSQNTDSSKNAPGMFNSCWEQEWW